MRLPITPERALLALLGITAVLAVLNAADQTWYYLGLPLPSVVHRVFDVDAERSIPTLFSTLLLLTAAVLLAVVMLANDIRARRSHRRNWAFLALVFVYLAMDEALGLHEHAIRPMRDLLGAGGILYYTWIVPAAICLVAFLAVNLRFLAELPGRTRMLFVLAGLIYVGSAAGMEMLEGVMAVDFGERSWQKGIIIAIEELGEMVGIAFFIYALLCHTERHLNLKQISLTFSSGWDGGVAMPGGALGQAALRGVSRSRELR